MINSVIRNVYIFNSIVIINVYVYTFGLYFGYFNSLLKLYDCFVHNIHIFYMPTSPTRKKRHEIFFNSRYVWKLKYLSLDKYLFKFYSFEIRDSDFEMAPHSLSESTFQ